VAVFVVAGFTFVVVKTNVDFIPFKFNEVNIVGVVGADVKRFLLFYNNF